MVSIDKEKSKEFFSKINKEQKVTIFCHTDLDGFSSGIQFYDFCKSKGVKDIEVHPITFGTSKISDFNLERDVILIGDLPPEIIANDLKLISSNRKVFYTDHHPKREFEIPEFIFEYRTEGSISSSRAIYEILGGKQWLSVAGVVADSGDMYPKNEEFIFSFLKSHGFSLESFKREIVYPLSLTLIYSENHPELDIFHLLSNIKDLAGVKSLESYAKEVQSELDYFISDQKVNGSKIGGVSYYFFNPKYHIKSMLINDISKKEPKEVFVFANPEGKVIRISSRNQSNRVDTALMLKSCTLKIPGAVAGGHKAASAAIIPKGYLEEFKKNLSNFSLKETRRVC